MSLKSQMVSTISWQEVKKAGIANYIRTNTPVVITDIDESLPLMSWSLDKAISHYGSVQLRVLKGSGQYLPAGHGAGNVAPASQYVPGSQKCPEPLAK